MNTLTTKDFGTPIDFTLEKAITVSPDAEAKKRGETKNITLVVKYQGVTLGDLANATLGQGATVKWQNTRGRDDYDKLTDKQRVEIDFKAPGAKVKTREEKIAELVATGMDLEIATFAIDNPEAFANIVNETVTTK